MSQKLPASQSVYQNANIAELVSSLEKEAVAVKGIGLLNNLWEAAVETVPVNKLDAKIFSRVASKVLGWVQTVLPSSGLVTPQDAEGLPRGVQEQVLGALESVLCLLGGLEGVARYVCESPELGDVGWLQLSALSVFVLKVIVLTYRHCQESGSVYGACISVVGEALQALFRKAYSLHMAYQAVLEKLLASHCDDAETDHLCTVCELLFEVVRSAQSLEVKVVVATWKLLQRIMSERKGYLCTTLDTDVIVTYLASDVTSGVGQMVEASANSSTGEMKAQQRKAKLVGFHYKLVVALVRDFSPYLTTACGDVFRVALTVHRVTSPCLREAGGGGEGVVAELQRHLVGAQPLISALLGSKHFAAAATAEQHAEGAGGDWLQRLLFFVDVMELLTQAEEEVVREWLAPTVYPEDPPRRALLPCVLHALANCPAELQSPLCWSGGASLYRHVVVTVSGFCGTVPQSLFSAVERALVAGVLAGRPAEAVAAADVWCFLARYGSGSLCLSQVKHLASLMTSLEKTNEEALAPPNLAMLHLTFGRLCTFVAEDDQDSLGAILQQHPAAICHELCLSNVSPECRTSPLASAVDGVKASVAEFRGEAETEAVTLAVVRRLTSWLRRLSVVLRGSQLQQRDGFGDVCDIIVALCASLNTADTCASEDLRRLVCAVIDVCSASLPVMTPAHLVQLLTSLHAHVSCDDASCEAAPAAVVLAVAALLRRFGTLRIPPSHEQVAVLHKLPVVFRSLLSHETDWLVQHEALTSFTDFAAATAHDTVVAECLPGQRLQQLAFAYVAKEVTREPDQLSKADLIRLQALQLEEMETAKRKAQEVTQVPVAEGESDPEASAGTSVGEARSRERRRKRCRVIDSDDADDQDEKKTKNVPDMIDEINDDLREDLSQGFNSVKSSHSDTSVDSGARMRDAVDINETGQFEVRLQDDDDDFREDWEGVLTRRCLEVEASSREVRSAISEGARPDREALVSLSSALQELLGHVKVKLEEGAPSL